ncbi:MAG: division/cell wall cluster transcriptional repressor MraZ [Candidatus Eisenbacteria bacterium]|uniref:Transcriptional regulator MraZ n=1 Tax=Eiseniibacteriota bacterium TaxID=2212470 RepID=A0A538TM92_UNCEI|nr:MAG: division/cell wall cluster transcriptional repressor MraZ [Candidatus Eisenbacteria bacterium]
MATFRGSYKHSIDHKGRVSIPARFRRLLSGDASETFVVLRGLDACVSLFPADEFKRLEDRLRSRSFSDPTHRRYQRHMLLDSRDETLDAQGRVAIPPSLIAHAALKKEVLVNGVLDHIEIWSPEEFEKYMASSDRTYEDMAGELLL